MNQSASVLRSSRREALFVAAVWAICCLYVVGYAALFAYRQESPPPMLWGIPVWVVWGIMLPWIVSTAVTVWFALCGIKDEDLGDERPVPDGHPAGEATRG